MNLSLLQNYDLLISQVLYLSTGMCVFLDRMWFSLFSLDSIMEVLALFCTNRQTVTTAAVHLNAQYVYLSLFDKSTAHWSMQGESASTHIIKFVCHCQSRQELIWNQESTRYELSDESMLKKIDIVPHWVFCL